MTLTREKSRADRRRALVAALTTGLLTVAVAGAACSGPTARKAVASEPPAAAIPPTTAARPPVPTTPLAATTTTASTTTTVPPATTTQPAPPATTRPAGPAATTTPCPQNMVSGLASTGSARQLITVDAATYATTVASISIWQRVGACWESAGGPWPGLIGLNGFSDHHREGDGTTPTGVYGIDAVMYGNGPNPGVREPYHQLVCGDWWDEDPTSATYNTFQHVPCGQSPPFGAGSEPLWTEIAPYPAFAVVDYNTDPIVPYAGSAIFVHADTGVPTTGCVSIPVPDLDQLLRWIDPADSPTIVMGPASEIDHF
jgi:L,D-peptidoglycan transpeptidase YkuD (ErfK/YbiS/YcfS/YnhG family)